MVGCKNFCYKPSIIVATIDMFAKNGLLESAIKLFQIIEDQV